MGLLLGNHTALLIFMVNYRKCGSEIQGGMMICKCVRVYMDVCIRMCTQTSTSNDCPGASRQTDSVCFAPCLPRAKSDGHTDRTACLLDVFKWLWWIGWIIDGDCMCFLCLQCDREQWQGMGLSKAITSKPSLTAQSLCKQTAEES